MTVAAAILAIITALLPLLIKWIDSKMEEPDEIDVLARTHAKEVKDMAAALEGGTAVDVAAVWARHDRVLLDAGLSRPGSGGDRSGRVVDRGEPRRDVHGLRGMDARAARVRTGPARRFRTVRTESGLELPIFD